MIKMQKGITIGALSLAVALLSGTHALAQSSTTAPTATPETVGTSTTSTEAIAPDSEKKFNAVFANATESSFDAAATTGGADTVNILSLTYKAQENLKTGVVITNEYHVAGEGEKSKSVFRDVGLLVSTTHGGFLGTEKTPVKYIVYLPTSEDSKAVKQAFTLNADISLDYNIAPKVTSNVHLLPYWYVRNGDDQLRHRLYGELRYAHTDAFSTFTYLDHDLRGMAGTSLEKSKENVALGVGAGYSPAKTVDLALSVARSRAIFKSAANNKSIDFELGDAKEINYTAEAVVRF